MIVDVCTFIKGLTRVKSCHTSLPISSCSQCGKTFAISDNLKRQKRTCTTVAAPTAGNVTSALTVTAPAPESRTMEKLQFTLQQTYKALGGVVEQFTINMKEAQRLPSALNVFKPAMAKFQQEHQAYKIQVAVSIVFHKAVDPADVAYPPVVLTSEIVAVYTDAVPPTR